MDADEVDAKVNKYAFYAAVASAVLLALAPVAVYLGVLARLFRWLAGIDR